MNAVDTNFLIYSLDNRDPLKQAKARLFLQQILSAAEPICLLWQVLGETVRQLQRWKALGLLTEAEFENQVQTFRTKFPLVMPVPGVLDHAIDVAKRYSLSHWDSMIIGACKEAGVAKLFTEDMGAPTMIDGIELINPLI